MQHPVAVELDGFTDPVGAFFALAAREPHVFWLDAGTHSSEGWSFLGTGDPEADPDVLRSHPVGLSDSVDASSAPFNGGWVGWFGYEDAAGRLGAPVAVSDPDAPGEAWLRARRWITFDHAARRLWAVSDGSVDPQIWARDVEELLVAPAPVVPDAVVAPPVMARHTAEQYAGMIGRCHDAIRAGDAYQLCLTSRFTVEASFDAVDAYLRLRQTSRTGLGSFIRIGDVAVCSATPERFLRVDGRTVRTRPIKGTRPRGSDADTDALLAAEMLASEKERAENVMIVDLMRNDLARVCEAGTVRVDGLLEVESYPHVHQLVSTVSGRLRDEMSLGELMLRTFPAGSMTGAPKLSAMTILHGLEGGPRGVFAGCIGWIGAEGNLDLAMVIRTIVVTPDRAYVGAGGGVTWSSIAEDEVHEVGLKARAPLAALGAALPPGW